MLVVVQSYPAHFYQTLLCLQSIKKLAIADSVYLCIDDISNLTWSSYVEDAIRTYQGLYDRIYTLSSSSALRRLRKWPWLRQQTCKLLLDTFIDRDEWLFIDGDVRLLHYPPLDRVSCAIRSYVGVPLDQREPGPGEMSSQILFYIRHMLGIEFEGFWADKQQNLIYTASNPPVKKMSASLLSKLRQHVETRFNRNLIDVHLALASDTRMAASEWDLIECYRQNILREPALWQHDSGFYETTWAADRELDKQWFIARNVILDGQIWDSLPKQKYF